MSTTGAAHLRHVDFQISIFFILTAKSKQTGSLRSGSFKARSLYTVHCSLYCIELFKTCLRDQYEDNELRHTVDLILVQEVKKSESNQYRCRVDYYEAEDGEKVKKSIEIKFPTEGCISAAGSEAECPADEDDSKDAAVGTFAPVTKNEDGKIKFQV